MLAGGGYLQPLYLCHCDFGVTTFVVIYRLSQNAVALSRRPVRIGVGVCLSVVSLGRTSSEGRFENVERPLSVSDQWLFVPLCVGEFFCVLFFWFRVILPRLLVSQGRGSSCRG